MGSCAEVHELFRKGEVDTNIWDEYMAKQFSKNFEGTSCLDKPRQCIWGRIWKGPDISEHIICELYILLIIWVEQIVDLCSSQVVRHKVGADNRWLDVNFMDAKAFVPKHQILKPFENMLVIFIGSQIVFPNL